MTKNEEWDVIVAGGGMAGLTAALSAREAGASALVLEKRGITGGNANHSAGMFLGTTDLDALHRYIPDGDLALQTMQCADYLPALDWLAGLGMALGPLVDHGDFRLVRGMGLGKPGNRADWLAAYAARARAGGVEIRTGAGVASVSRSADDYGVTAEDGSVHRASAVVLSTGGFQGDAARLKEVLGPAAESLFLRSVPECAGDGLTLGLALGAATAGRLDAFYGHSLPDIPLAPDQWQRLTPYFSRSGILLNRDGRRFTDEAASFLEETSPQDGCRQKGGRYWLVFNDAAIHAEDAARGSAADLLKVDWMAEARAAGAPILSSESLDGLVGLLAADGVDGRRARDTIDGYNAACRRGGAIELDPPRSQPAMALTDGPFHAMRCRPGITGTTGGIAVDVDLRALGADGVPVPGLYVAGIDAGGYFGRTYNGFLGWSLVSGRRAGRGAAAHAAG